MIWPTEEEKLGDRPKFYTKSGRLHKSKQVLRSFSHSQATNACCYLTIKLVVQDLNAEHETVTEILVEKKRKALNTLKVMHVAFKL